MPAGAAARNLCISYSLGRVLRYLYHQEGYTSIIQGAAIHLLGSGYGNGTVGHLGTIRSFYRTGRFVVRFRGATVPAGSCKYCTLHT